MTKPTGLASKIAGLLLSGHDRLPGFIATETGEYITPKENYLIARAINRDAVGSAYTAYGFTYLLCFDTSVEINYVAIHQEHDARLVAVMDDVDSIQACLEELERVRTASTEEDAE